MVEDASWQLPRWDVTLRNASSATYSDLCRDHPGGLARTSSRRNVAKSRTEFYFVQRCAQVAEVTCYTVQFQQLVSQRGCDTNCWRIARCNTTLTAIHLSLIFRFFKCLLFRQRIGYTALKLSCVTNFGMLFLVMGFICLFHKKKFMLISGGHISNRKLKVDVGMLNTVKIYWADVSSVKPFVRVNDTIHCFTRYADADQH